MDRLTPSARSENMRRIHSRDTGAEITVRSIAHRLGYRFRLQRKDLPGKPDLVFPKLRKVIFVHGCFWHQHTKCADGRLPKSRTEYWGPKLSRNKQRDSVNRRALTLLGWKSLVIWECEIQKPEHIVRIIEHFLGHE